MTESPASSCAAASNSNPTDLPPPVSSSIASGASRVCSQRIPERHSDSRTAFSAVGVAVNPETSPAEVSTTNGTIDDGSRDTPGNTGITRGKRSHRPRTPTQVLEQTEVVANTRASPTLAAIAARAAPAPDIRENAYTSRQARSEAGGGSDTSSVVPRSSSAFACDMSSETSAVSLTGDLRRTSPYVRRQLATGRSAAPERQKCAQSRTASSPYDMEVGERVGMYPSLWFLRGDVGLEWETSPSKHDSLRSRGRHHGSLPFSVKKHSQLRTPPKRHCVREGVAEAAAARPRPANDEGDIDVNRTPEAPVSIKVREDYAVTRRATDKRKLCDLTERVREGMEYRAKRELFPPSQEDSVSSGGRKRHRKDINLVPDNNRHHHIIRSDHGETVRDHVTATAFIPSTLPPLVSPPTPKNAAKKDGSIRFSSSPLRREDESKRCNSLSRTARVNIGFAPKPKRPRFAPPRAFNNCEGHQAVSTSPPLLPALEVTIGGHREQAMRAMEHLLGEGQPMEGLLAWSEDSQCFWTTVCGNQAWGTKRNVNLGALREMLSVMSALVKDLEFTDSTEGAEIAPPACCREHDTDNLIEKGIRPQSPRTSRRSCGTRSVDLGECRVISHDTHSQDNSHMGGSQCRALEPLSNSCSGVGDDPHRGDRYLSTSSPSSLWLSSSPAAVSLAEKASSDFSYVAQRGSKESRPQRQGSHERVLNDPDGVDDHGGDKKDVNIETEGEADGNSIRRKSVPGIIVVRRLDMEND